VDFLAGVVRDIKESTAADGTPGMGITLSVGELDRGQYQRLWEAGAHRYLLRIESSNPVIFKTIHPPNQSYKKRLLCLDYLREIGYQVGTGVMVGLPGQTYSDLANDLFFFQQQDIDMLGMDLTYPILMPPCSG
jgi:biotin synthase